MSLTGLEDGGVQLSLRECGTVCVCVCVCIHTNPATYVGTITDWIGVPAELSLHIQPPRVQRGGVGLGTCFCFPTGSMAWLWLLPESWGEP